MSDIAVRRVDFGWFVRPGSETLRGVPRVEPCLGYLVEHPEGTLLFDTGMGSHPEVDEHYQPQRVDLRAALAAAGSSLDAISHVANCHLHFDHCGGNPLVGSLPIFVQRTELSAARTTEDYTLPELLEGGRFQVVDGEVEVLPGVFVLPTPGHTDGHQSLVVRRPDGAVILAGQSHETASDYAADQLAWQAQSQQYAVDPDPREGHVHAHGLPRIPAWIGRLQEFDPRIVYFAHDHSAWMP